MTAAPVAPSELAVVLAAHGDRGGTGANDALLFHRDTLVRADRYASVSAGVLKGDLTLEAALSAADASSARHIAVYPFFMADGYFVRTRLAGRLAAAGLRLPWTLLSPLGVDPELPHLILRQSLAAAEAAGFQSAATDLLVVGHGSQIGPASADATRAAAARIAAANTFRSVTTAFLEEPPSVAEALHAATEPVVVTGFFSGDGLHAGEDVPEAIAASGRRAVYAGPIGGDPAVAPLIERELQSLLGRASVKAG